MWGFIDFDGTELILTSVLRDTMPGTLSRNNVQLNHCCMTTSNLQEHKFMQFYLPAEYNDNDEEQHGPCNTHAE